MSKKRAQQSVHLTLGILRQSQAVFYALAFFWLDGFAVPAPAQVTQTVRRLPYETISKTEKEYEQMMSLDDFAVLAGAVQSLIVSIAVVIGGGWALYQFISLNSIAKSKAELESIKRSLSKRAVIETIIEHEIFPHPTLDIGKCLLCTVHIKNIGSHVELIDESKTSLVAIPLSLNKDESIIVPSDNKLVAFFYFDQEYPLTSIQAGTCEDLHFVILLPKAGIYGLTFETHSVSVSEDEVFELKSVLPALDISSGRSMVQTVIYV